MPKTPRFPPKPRRTEILAFPGVQLLDVAGPLLVFATANVIATKSGGVTPYDLQVVAPKGAAITTSAGLGLVTAPLPRVRSAT